MAAEPDPGTPEPVEDVRSTRPSILSPPPLKTLARRLASVLALATIDIAGLVIRLYLALALRAVIVDPKPVLWGLLWDHERDWIAFLILLLVLVFWQAGLYKPRETREGAARVVPSVFLVAALSLAFAIGTGEGSLGMAEKLRLDQLIRYRTAIDGDEGAFSTTAPQVYRPGDDLLARA